jgi:hypothetical protein
MDQIDAICAMARSKAQALPSNTKRGACPPKERIRFAPICAPLASICGKNA